jgi:excisionase family DNA binding protein
MPKQSIHRGGAFCDPNSTPSSRTEQASGGARTAKPITVEITGNTTGKAMQGKLLLGMNEAGEALSCSPWTVRKLIYSGRLVGVKVGTRLCVERAELERFVTQNRTRLGRR